MGEKRIIHVSCEMDDSEPFRLFTMAENGTKTVEIRLLVPGSRYWDLTLFDKATLSVTCKKDSTRSFTRDVIDSIIDVSLFDLLTRMGVNNCVPGAEDEDDAIERFYKTVYGDKIDRYPVMAIILGKMTKDA